MCRVGLLWPGNAAIFCPAPRWLRGGSPAPRRAPTIPHAPEGSKGHAGAREGPHSWLGARFASASVAIASSSRRRSSRKAFSGSSPSETGAGAATFAGAGRPVAAAASRHTPSLPWTKAGSRADPPSPASFRFFTGPLSARKATPPSSAPSTSVVTAPPMPLLCFGGAEALPTGRAATFFFDPPGLPPGLTPPLSSTAFLAAGAAAFRATGGAIPLSTGLRAGAAAGRLVARWASLAWGGGEAASVSCRGAIGGAARGTAARGVAAFSAALSAGWLARVWLALVFEASRGGGAISVDGAVPPRRAAARASRSAASDAARRAPRFAALASCAAAAAAFPACASASACFASSASARSLACSTLTAVKEAGSPRPTLLCSRAPAHGCGRGPRPSEPPQPGEAPPLLWWEQVWREQVWRQPTREPRRA